MHRLASVFGVPPSVIGRRQSSHTERQLRENRHGQGSCSDTKRVNWKKLGATFIVAGSYQLEFRYLTLAGSYLVAVWYSFLSGSYRLAIC